MSYLLQFPTSSLPSNIRAPPYVVFAIQGEDVSQYLPTTIPLNMVLHFAPKMREWVLPTPTNLPEKAAQLALRFDMIGINIPAPVHRGALLSIIKKMGSEIGIDKASQGTLVKPSLTASIAIAKACATFELPPGHSEMLRLHIISTITTGSALTLSDMKELWDAFGANRTIIMHTAENFARSHANFSYPASEFEAITKWIGQNESRRNIFQSILNNSSKRIETPAKPKKDSLKVLEDAAVSNSMKGNPTASGNAQLLAQQRKRAASIERRNKERADLEALKHRLSRIRSESNLRSIDDPDPEPKNAVKGGRRLSI